MWGILFLSTLCYAVYDPIISKYMVELAQASYCVSSPTQWNCITCNPSIKLEYVVETNGVRALQGFDSYTNSLFIAFRGSSNMQNWIDNIQISKVSPYNDTSISVEKGFYKAYSYVRDKLLSYLPDLVGKYNTNSIIITGHSLGGALATLMTYNILTVYPGYSILYLINFGSPRVGNPAFVQHLNDFSFTYYRITHHYDMVPHVPEEFVGYLHISNEIWYNEDNTNFIVCNDYNDEDNMCSNSCSPTHCTSTSDHLYYLNVSMGSGSSGDQTIYC